MTTYSIYAWSLDRLGRGAARTAVTATAALMLALQSVVHGLGNTKEITRRIDFDNMCM